LKTLKAAQIMVRPVVSARKNATARDIALQLLAGYYSGMPVTDDEGHVIGVVTEFDLLEAVQAGKDLTKTTADEIMTTEVVTADLETPVSELIKIMTDEQVIRLPITAKGKLVGVVARCDVLKTLIEPEFVAYA
jgi:CBS-domain-containing membrane protein